MPCRSWAAAALQFWAWADAANTNTTTTNTTKIFDFILGSSPNNQKKSAVSPAGKLAAREQRKRRHETGWHRAGRGSPPTLSTRVPHSMIAPADPSGGWPVSVRLESTLSSPDHAPWVDGVAPWIAANGGLILSNRRVATPRRARKPDVLEDPYRHLWCNCSPHHQDGPPARHQDRAGLLRGRRRFPRGGDVRREGLHRPPARRPVLSAGRQDRRSGATDERRGGAPRLRFPVRERGLRAQAGGREDRLHRPQSPRHRGDGRQDHFQEVRRRGGRLARARLHGLDRRRRARGQDRRLDRLSG